MEATEQQKGLEEKKYKCETATADELLTEKNTSNPMFMAQLMVALKDERERTNSMLATVIRKMESLEMKVESLEAELAKAKKKEKKEILLGEVDSELLSYIKQKRMVTADEVQAHFNYKGKNAASSRMHKLYAMGLLDKKQAGRKVYYIMK